MPVIPQAEIAAVEAKRRSLVPAGSSAPKTAQELRLSVDHITFAKGRPLRPVKGSDALHPGVLGGGFLVGPRVV